MSFKLQLDVDNATVGELSALLSAARAAGGRDGDALNQRRKIPAKPLAHGAAPTA